VLIIDDHPIIEEGLKSRILKVFPNAHCFFVSTSRDAISYLHQHPTELVFCDLEFNDQPKTDGFTIVNTILKKYPKIKVIAHTNYNSYRIMKKVTDSGFQSFLYKGCSFQDFSDTVKNVLLNGNYTSQSMKELLKKRNNYLRSIFTDSLYGVSNLSKKELSLTLLARKTTDKSKLAKKMGNTPSTIDTYFQHIIKKLKLKNRQEVALFSLEFYDELIKARKEI